MKCVYVKEGGLDCNANSMTDSDYCYLHNPEIPEESKKQAQAKGGEARSLTLEKPLPELPLNTPNDAVTLVADTIKRVRAGELDIKTANCIGFLSDKLLKAFEVSRLNEKVEYIERVIVEKRATGL
jgi:hypothetical protein